MNKNKIVFLVLLVIAVLFITGCSRNNTPNNNNNNNNNNNGIDNSKTYDLIWWNLFASEEVMQPLIDKYEQQNPNVNIRYVQRTEGLESGELIENYRGILDENLNDNEPLDTPDIVTIHNTWLGRYQPKLSVSTGVNATDITNDYFPVVTQDFVRKGNVYSVPLSMDSLAIIANTDLMAQLSAADSAGPESSWFNLLDQSKRVTKSDGSKIEIAGLAAGLDNVEYMTEVVSLLMMQSNVTMTQEDQLSGFASSAVFSSNTESQNVANFYRRFFSEQKVWDQTFENETASFLSEKLCMYIAPSWRLNDILKIKSQYGLEIEPEVYKLPQINPDPNNHIYWADYWGLSVTRDSQDRQQSQVAWDFIKFLSQPEQLELINTQIQAQENNQIGIIYPRKSMALNQKSDPLLSPYVESLEKARSWDMIDGFLVKDIFKKSFGQGGNPSIETIQNEVNTNVISKRATLITTGP